MSDPVLVLAVLVLAHLGADYVLQNDWMVTTKTQPDGRAWMGFAAHGAIVALTLAPVAVAFRAPGLMFVLLVTASHVLIDRWKVRATRHAEAMALAAARRLHATTGEGLGAGLGSAWTPGPAIHHLLDQAAHLTVTIVGWLVLLSGAPLDPTFVAAVDRALGTWDRSLVHEVALTGVVFASLLIVNTRGAYYFVATLLYPRSAAAGMPEPPSEPTPAPPPATPAPGYVLRLGPVVASVEPTGPAATVATSPVPRPVPPPRVGATIGVIERLLIVTFVLTNAAAAIGLVIAAKTLARFKQLDDRGFAEYYLLGTLASVAVALGSALVGAAALGTLR